MHKNSRPLAREQREGGDSLYYNLVLALKRAQLTQKGLAMKLGISQHTMGKKLNGEVDFWLSEVKAICQVLGVTDLQTAAALFKRGGSCLGRRQERR